MGDSEERLYEYKMPVQSSMKQGARIKQSTKMPIVIDNGSYECRVGFASMKKPQLVFPNLVSKSRFKHISTLVGNEIDFSADVGNLKSPYENGILSNLDTQEVIFDHIFSQLNITDDKVKHPIVMSEPYGNFRFLRSLCSELLFELYRVPSVSYFVDSLAAFHYNASRIPVDTGRVLLASTGYHATHLIPINNNKVVWDASRRINFGGFNCVYTVQKLLQLKYPCHGSQFTYHFASDVFHKFGAVAEDFKPDFLKWKDTKYSNKNTVSVLLPFTTVGEAEIQAAIDRKQQRVVRLREFRRRKIQSMLDEAKERVKQLKMLSENELRGNQLKKLMESAQVNSMEDVQTELEAALSHASSLEEKLGVMDEKTDAEGTEKSEALPSEDSDPFATDVTLSSLSQFRGRARSALDALVSHAQPAAVIAQMVTGNANEQGLSEAQFQLRKAAAKEIEESCGDDYLLWLQSVRYRQARVTRQRTQRQGKLELAAEFGLRPSQAELQADAGMSLQPASTGDSLMTSSRGEPLTERRRMQLERLRAMTAELNSNRMPGTPAVKKTKTAAGKGKGKSAPPRQSDAKAKEKQAQTIEDTCMPTVPGIDDTVIEEMDDQFEASALHDNLSVSVQREVHVPRSFKSRLEVLQDNADNQSECERNELAIYDAVLALYDPDSVKDIVSSEYQVNAKEYHTVKIGSELMRAAEVVFQPSLFGQSQCGLGECMEWVLRDTDRALREQEAEEYAQPWSPQLVLLYGGLTKLPGFEERVLREITQRVPFDLDDRSPPPKVVRSLDPSLDAWRGAAVWAESAISSASAPFVTRALYDECGHDYLIENELSNRY